MTTKNVTQNKRQNEHHNLKKNTNTGCLLLFRRTSPRIGRRYPQLFHADSSGYLHFTICSTQYINRNDNHEMISITVSADNNFWGLLVLDFSPFSCLIMENLISVNWTPNYISCVPLQCHAFLIAFYASSGFLIFRICT